MATKLIDVICDAESIFRARPNRFLGLVDILKNDQIISANEKIHVHDPGRLNELLYPGNHVLIKHISSKVRSTTWDLIAAKYNGQWVLVHSGYHRAITEAILNNSSVNPFGEIEKIIPEYRVGHSRLDFLLTRQNEKRIYVEVKGCTLTKNGTALFPDAPTERGTKHVRTLMDLYISGEDAALIVLIFRSDSLRFAPNQKTDSKFTSTFFEALELGIDVFPLVLKYEGGTIYFEKKIPVMKEDALETLFLA